MRRAEKRSVQDIEKTERDQPKGQHQEEYGISRSTRFRRKLQATAVSRKKSLILKKQTIKIENKYC